VPKELARDCGSHSVDHDVQEDGCRGGDRGSRRGAREWCGDKGRLVLWWMG
jgi:hypothetical protein